MALLALMWAGPAWAGCTLEFNAGNPAPRVELCINGKCENTELVRHCSTADISYDEWKNGFATENNADGSKTTATFRERPVVLKKFSCTSFESDGAGCPGETVY